MNKRIVVILGVFVVGFAIGWGVTSLVVTGSGPAAVATAPPPTAAPDAGGAATVAGAGEPAPAADAGGSALVATAGAAEAAADVVDAPPDAGAVAAADPDTVEAAEPDTAVGAPETAPPVFEADTVEAPAPAADLPWWDACRDKKCRVDFGRVTGGVSVRRASLEHGATVDWQRDFDKKKKLGVLSAGADVWVTVHGVGMTDGEPSAASITFKGGGETLTGVIALSIGDKQIKFVPPAP
ncbi:MAG: hypothetical protein H6745_27305 [Deltaproteobacteria bacterium]|nr:hypothetical protein [Deltaproteobacteria bacterium]